MPARDRRSARAEPPGFLGKRILVRVVRITGCTGVPGVGGCLFPKRYDVALARVMRGYGTFGFGSAF